MSNTDDLKAYAAGVATKYGVPVNLFLAQITQESGWNPTLANPASSAYGIAQVLTGTAADPGYGVAPLLDRSDPRASLDFAAAYDAALYNHPKSAARGSWSAVMDAYGTGSNTKPVAAALASLGTDANGTKLSNCGKIPWWPSFLCGYNTDGSPKSDKQLADTGTPTSVGQIWDRLVSGLSSVTTVIVGLILMAGALYLFGKK